MKPVTHVGLTLREKRLHLRKDPDRDSGSGSRPNVEVTCDPWLTGLDLQFSWRSGADPDPDPDKVQTYMVTSQSFLIMNTRKAVYTRTKLSAEPCEWKGSRLQTIFEDVSVPHWCLSGQCTSMTVKPVLPFCNRPKLVSINLGVLFFNSGQRSISSNWNLHAQRAAFVTKCTNVQGKKEALNINNSD